MTPIRHRRSRGRISRRTDFFAGSGWYRKHCDVPAAWSGKHINLECDGVVQVAEMFVNDRHIGEHKGGYTGFTFDITHAVNTGDNVVAVRVNHIGDGQLAPQAGERTFSGGIYRAVRRVVTAPDQVAWYGTCVTTPQVSKESGTVNVREHHPTPCHGLTGNNTACLRMKTRLRGT
jgi:hypothetical protein